LDPKEPFNPILDSTEPEEIPMAVRDTPQGFIQPGSQASPNSQGWLVGGLAGTIAAIVLGVVFFLVYGSPNLSQSRSQNNSPPDPIGPSPDAPESVLDPNSEVVDVVLGHRKYEEVPAEDLVAIDVAGEHLLQAAAAEAWFTMEAEAEAVGIYLVPLSAFRSVEIQDYLFFAIKEQRGQDAAKRAEVSAPPGYSEHHTGYAIDIGDYDFPAADFSQSFEDTPAFRWLEANAGFYGFELSFPPDNSQGISYEPWHWRYVGNQESLEMFYKQSIPESES
jgi:D-alanyl-D-alanine carboxypeptidase